MRLIQTFPSRAGHDAEILKLAQPRTDYPKIHEAAWKLLKAGHVTDLLSATYDRLIVDECQDCMLPQFAIVYYAALGLPTCVLGDPMQAIFDFAGKLPDWDEHVCKYFPLIGELTTPWRWKNADAEALGLWLLEVRTKLLAGEAIDLREAPPEVTWVHLDGTDDYGRKLKAARTRAPGRDGCVLIIEDSTRPQRQQEIASQTPGAVTIESVDLRDLVEFSRDLDLTASDALRRIVTFAAIVMTNVGAADLLQRVGSLQRGTARRETSDVELAALIFNTSPCAQAAIDLLVEINKQGGVRPHRPAVLRACIRALQTCDGTEGNTFHDATVRAREQNRLFGRPLPSRAVVSTLLLKGLEADVSVVLNAADLNARNLYVAMTRGSKALVICSPSPILKPA
jgi:DNA helicase-2/ATP-dependent DNA helicase PcrA